MTIAERARRVRDRLVNHPRVADLVARYGHILQVGVLALSLPFEMARSMCGRQRRAELVIR